MDSRLFTGTGTTTVISYELDGRPGRLTLRGMPYVDGVVLADSRRPERGMVVSQFPHPVRPGPDGQWAGALSPGRWVWVALSLAVQLGLLALASGSSYCAGDPGPGAERGAGGRPRAEARRRLRRDGQGAGAARRGEGRRPTTAIPPYGDPQAQTTTPEQLAALFANQMQTQLSPQAVEQLQRVMQRLGLDQTVGPALGFAAAPPSPPSPEVVGRLADPPRPVPLAFRVATFDWSWWELFGVGPRPGHAARAVDPRAGRPSPRRSWSCPRAIVVFRGRRYVRRTRLLKWGKVATVTGHTLVDKGTYYSGMTYNNMLMRSARGWTVTRQWYSGPGYTTDISYTLDGTSAVLRNRGLAYVDGVVLADSRQPTRAMVVHQFPYDLTPGPGRPVAGSGRRRRALVRDLPDAGDGDLAARAWP